MTYERPSEARLGDVGETRKETPAEGESEARLGAISAMSDDDYTLKGLRKHDWRFFTSFPLPNSVVALIAYWFTYEGAYEGIRRPTKAYEGGTRRLRAGG